MAQSTLLRTGFGNLTRAFSSTAATNAAIQNVTVIGGGLMGGGIAQVAAQAGNKVTVVEVKDDAVAKAKATIENNVKRVGAKMFKDDAAKGEAFVKNTISNLSYTTDLHKAVSDSELVIEAIIENLKLKQDLFANIDKVAPEKTIFASNTSSIPIKEIAELTSRKDRFGGLHFFSPVPIMKLLEVVRTDETSEDTYSKIDAWGKAIGKVTVSCKDTPGFIVNRLLIPYSMEAVKMLERGDATAKDIDTAMKLGAGYPMGPFELADFVGVDIGLFIMEGWEKRFPGDPAYKVPELVRNMVKEGKLGRKSGEGYYKYNKK